MKRMMNNVFLTMVAATVFVFGQSGDFTVSGIVKSGGQPLEGATASYTSLGKRLSWDISGTTGAFGSSATAIAVHKLPGSVAMQAHGSVSIEVFDVLGNKVTSFSTVLEKGKYSIETASSKLPKSVYLIKVTGNGTVSYQTYVNTGKSAVFASANTGVAGGSVVLAKKLAVVDSVRIGKTGYTPVKVAIQSYTDNIGTVTLTKVDIESQVNALMGTMSTAEMAGQLVQIDCPSSGDVTGKVLGTVFGGGSDGPNSDGSGSPSGWATFNDRYRQMGSGFKSPIITEWDVIHGFGKCNGATVYPHNIGLGCTWDTTIVQKCYRVAGIESRGCGIILGYGPCIAVPQDYRWGRVYEGFSGSPVLTAAMARAAVLGSQTTDLSNPLAYAACVKHFAGDGGSTQGLNPGATVGDEATLESIHLPGYTAAIKAGVASVMASYSTWNGTNCTQNKALLTDWLKTAQGFDGYVNSDWSATYNFGNDTKIAFQAGLDVPMLGANSDAGQNGKPSIGSVATDMLNSNGSDAARIKDAVARVLRLKYKMDLFHQPLSTSSALTALVGSQAHRDVAREAVRKSLVLLKTPAGLLPLSKTAKITLVGPHAQDIGMQCGGWTLGWQGVTGNAMPGTTIMAGFQSIGGTANISYSSDGSSITGDVAVVCIGEKPYAETNGDIIDGDANVVPRTMSIPEANLVTTAISHASGKKVIVVMITGRPMDISAIMSADAIIAAWLPGTEGGGIAEVLYGQNAAGTAHYNFTGKLGMAFPANANSEPTKNGVGTTVRYAYGFGLKADGTTLPAGLYGAGVNP